MNNIVGIEKIYNIVNTWSPTDLAFIKKIEWSNGNLNITFLGQSRTGSKEWPDFSKYFYQLNIFFEFVSNLSVHFGNSGDVQQISGFDIIDVSNRSLENINFEIEDYENGDIKFNCKNIKIEQISVSEHIGL